MESKRMRLDSSANIYPAIATSDYPQVYRLSISVITAVVPELLEQAVRETLPFFPAFHGRLKRGRFWYSLEKTDSMPEIRKVLFRKIQPFAEDGLLFRFLIPHRGPGKPETVFPEENGEEFFYLYSRRSRRGGNLHARQSCGKRKAAVQRKMHQKISGREGCRTGFRAGEGCGQVCAAVPEELVFEDHIPL